MSVRDREVRATKVFVWDAAARDYVEAEIGIVLTSCGSPAVVAPTASL